MPATLENSAMVTEQEKVTFISIPKEDNDKECSNYCSIVLISHVSKVVSNLFQVGIQRYTIRQLPEV